MRVSWALGRLSALTHWILDDIGRTLALVIVLAFGALVLCAMLG